MWMNQTSNSIRRSSVHDKASCFLSFFSLINKWWGPSSWKAINFSEFYPKSINQTSPPRAYVWLWEAPGIRIPDTLDYNKTPMPNMRVWWPNVIHLFNFRELRCKSLYFSKLSDVCSCENTKSTIIPIICHPIIIKNFTWFDDKPLSRNNLMYQSYKNILQFINATIFYSRVLKSTAKIHVVHNIY